MPTPPRRPGGPFDSNATRAILTEEFKDDITYLEDELLVIPNGTPEGCQVFHVGSVVGTLVGSGDGGVVGTALGTKEK